MKRCVTLRTHFEVPSNQQNIYIFLILLYFYFSTAKKKHQNHKKQSKFKLEYVAFINFLQTNHFISNCWARIYQN